MWNWIKAIPAIIQGIKAFFGVFGKIKKSWHKWKMNRALKKAKNKKNTEDLQKEISKHL